MHLSGQWQRQDCGQANVKAAYDMSYVCNLPSTHWNTGLQLPEDVRGRWQLINSAGTGKGFPLDSGFSCGEKMVSTSRQLVLPGK